MQRSYVFTSRTYKLLQLFDRGAIGVSRTLVPPPRMLPSKQAIHCFGVGCQLWEAVWCA